MKKLILILALVSTSAFAQHRGNYGGNQWIAPLIIGGAIGYGLSQNRPVQQVPSYGTIYQQPIYSNPPMQPVYQEVVVYNQDCFCYMKQYRQIGWQ